MSAQIQAASRAQTTPQPLEPTWRSLYTAGGASALVIAALFLIEMVAYIATSAPPLSDALGWFSLFQHQRLVGLIDFGILELYGLVLFVPLYLSLCLALRRSAAGTLAVAAGLALVGIAANFATSKLFTLLTLSDLYASASGAAQQAQFLALGRSVLAVSALGGIGGSVEGGIPLAVSGLLIAAVMLHSGTLGRAAGVLGLLANLAGLAMYLNAAAGPAPDGSPFFLAFFLLSVLWYLLSGVQLLRLARGSQ